MLEKIEQNLTNKRYVHQIASSNVTAYVNHHGWTDYLIAGKIILSHRENDYSCTDFPEYLHTHDFYEIVVYLGGDMQYIADNQYLEAKSGAVILTKPLSVHMVRLMSPSFCDRYVLYFKRDLGLPPALSDTGIFDFLDTAGATSNYLYFGGEDRAKLFERLSCLEALLKRADRGTDAMALAYVIELFVLFGHASATHGSSYAKLRTSAPQSIHEIKHYIDEHCAELKSVADLSGIFFYSREYITRAFKRYFNTPVYEYIVTRKLLLSRTYISAGLSIEEAAQRAGFANMSSFIKQFKKATGMTPSAYRDRERAKE